MSMCEADFASSGKAPEVTQAEIKAGILDSLDEYLPYIKRLRKRDPDAYKTYRRIGAYILPPSILADRRGVEPAIQARPPAFGAIAIGIGTRNDSVFSGVPVRFVYFTKINPGTKGVERVNAGVVYKVCFYHDDIKNQKIRDIGAGVTRTFYVQLAPDGDVRALRVLKDERQVIRHRKGGVTEVCHQRWGVPPGFETGDDRNHQPLSTFIREAFTLCLNFWGTAAREHMIRVNAVKGGITMPFSVDPTRTATFFGDREHVVEAGVTKRIFHVVRPHVRRKPGRAVGVKLHFRGLQNFMWKGYSISITVPGRGSADLADFDLAAAVLPDDDVTPPGFMYLSEGADGVIADAIGAP